LKRRRRILGSGLTSLNEKKRRGEKPCQGGGNFEGMRKKQAVIDEADLRYSPLAVLKKAACRRGKASMGGGKVARRTDASMAPKTGKKLR